jgi:LmbE family N-acetylglucosaminyl deacetylase
LLNKRLKIKKKNKSLPLKKNLKQNTLTRNTMTRNTMTRKLSAITFLICICFFNAMAQKPHNLHTGEIQLALKKLNVLGSVLYIAAHPDDENTAMLAYLANDRLVRTGYLSLTRGDGGQNLIGAEQSELLGLIRTQELLQARAIDGAEQFFTRANDFGFSKTAQETEQIWDKEKILADMVWTIRKFKPDVMITRFPPSRMAGHGHHEASSLLALEAFEAAANPEKYPEQLKYVSIWQAKRLVWNSYSIRQNNFSNLPPDSLKVISVEIGTYNPLLGKSHPEIAAESRSMHKSQGFGSSKNRGERLDNFTHFKGEVAKEDIFDQINITWDRIKGSEEIQKLLKHIYHEFNAERPADIVPWLVKAWKMMAEFPKQDEYARYWLEIKQKEIEKILPSCLGLWLEANATEHAVSVGDSLKIKLEAVNRADFKVTLEKVEIWNHQNGKLAVIDSLPKALEKLKLWNPQISILIPDNESITQPYWLVKSPLKGMFQVDDLTLIGLPENPPILQALFSVHIADQSFTFPRPITYKWVKPEEGELYRNLQITPEVMVIPEHNLYVFADDMPKTLHLKVKAGKANVKGQIKPELSAGWKTEPSLIDFEFKTKDQEQTFDFQIIPPKTPQETALKIRIKTDKHTDFQLADGILSIEYPHIPIQTVFPEAVIKLTRLDVKTKGKNIGYIEGAGDDIPLFLKQMGYHVTMLSERDFQKPLAHFDAIIAGVRAYNTQTWLKHIQPKLMNYVQNGGIYLVQYQTQRLLAVQEFGPYPFNISRERVTVEEAPITFSDQKHPILNTPNQITAKDFEGWVQERGLYFADKWDEHYQTPIACNDPDEKSLSGGLLFTNYGKGKFIYTGYSFFRQIPAGVSGAYRLLVNLISK